MPIEAQMTINERRKYLPLMLPRYQRADRAERSRLLDERQAVTTLERKSLLRLLHADTLERQPRRQQRGATYDHHFDEALRLLAETLDYACAERLQPVLPELALQLAAHGELTLTTDLLIQLQQASVSTVRRHLAHLTQDQPRLPRARPLGRRSVAREIPMRRIPWQLQTPGHLETDLVHHGGDTAVGDYVHTLQMIDVATGWSERVAGLGRSQRALGFSPSPSPYPLGHS